MSAAGCAANNNEMQWKEAGLEEMQARSKQRGREWEMCPSQKLISSEPGRSLNSDATDLRNLGTTPTNGGSRTTGPVLTQRVCFYSAPKILQTKQFGWQLDFHSLPWREASFGLCLESASAGQ